MCLCRFKQLTRNPSILNIRGWYHVESMQKSENVFANILRRELQTGQVTCGCEHLRGQ